MKNDEIIDAVLRSLNTISVSGIENMEKILGCVGALTQLREQIMKDGEENGTLPNNK